MSDKKRKKKRPWKSAQKKIGEKGGKNGRQEIKKLAKKGTQKLDKITIEEWREGIKGIKAVSKKKETKSYDEKVHQKKMRAFSPFFVQQQKMGKMQ